MNQSDAHLFKLTAIIFDGALGSYYYPSISALQTQIGIDSLAQGWGASELAQSFLGTTPEAQAKSLALNFGLNPDSTDPASADKIAYDFFLSNLNSGMNVGTLALAAIRYLEQDEILPILEATKDYLENRAEVAYQYSNELGLGGAEVEELQAAIEDVTSDEKSVPKVLQDIVLSQFDEIRVSSEFTDYSDNDDVITGTDGADLINAGSGFDTVNSGAGADIIIGGTGDDILYGEQGQDFIEGGDGADTIYAGTYYDREYVSGYYDDQNNYVDAYYRYTVDANFEVLDGGGGADLIYGSYGSDRISGGDGADTIYGEGNSSFYYYNEVYNFDSSVDARLFDDIINGGEGEDRIYAQFGSDEVYGGGGDDLIYLNHSSSNKTEADGQNEGYGEDGDDTIYAVGNDGADGGNGNDLIYFYRTDNSSDHGVIIGGEGSDQIYVNYYNRNTSNASNITIDLEEQTQVQDNISVGLPNRNTSFVEIQHFDLDTDTLDLNEFINIYSSDDSYNGRVYTPQSINYNGDVLQNYVQIVDSETTAWLEYSYDRAANNTPESYGKAYFVIQGEQAASSSTRDVAALIDNYGNDASYGNTDKHMFLVNVSDSDMGIYMFTDDTGANNRIVSDELTPIAVLTGITTEDITYNNIDFLI